MTDSFERDPDVICIVEELREIAKCYDRVLKAEKIAKLAEFSMFSAYECPQTFCNVFTAVNISEANPQCPAIETVEARNLRLLKLAEIKKETEQNIREAQSATASKG